MRLFALVSAVCLACVACCECSLAGEACMPAVLVYDRYGVLIFRGLCRRHSKPNTHILSQDLGHLRHGKLRPMRWAQL